VNTNVEIPHSAQGQSRRPCTIASHQALIISAGLRASTEAEAENDNPNQFWPSPTPTRSLPEVRLPVALEELRNLSPFGRPPVGVGLRRMESLRPGQRLVDPPKTSA
jgi:hypothetical protein